MCVSPRNSKRAAGAQFARTHLEIGIDVELHAVIIGWRGRFYIPLDPPFLRGTQGEPPVQRAPTMQGASKQGVQANRVRGLRAMVWGMNSADSCPLS